MKIAILTHRLLLKFQHRQNTTKKETKILQSSASIQKSWTIKLIVWAIMIQSNQTCLYGSIGSQLAKNGITRGVPNAKKLLRNTVSVQTVDKQLNKLHCTFQWELKFRTDLDQFGLPLMMNSLRKYSLIWEPRLLNSFKSCKEMHWMRN